MMASKLMLLHLYVEGTFYFDWIRMKTTKELEQAVVFVCEYECLWPRENVFEMRKLRTQR